MMFFAPAVLLIGGALVFCDAGETSLNQTSDIEIGKRIYNGQYAYGSNFKVFIRLDVTFEDKSVVLCSGTVISDRAILTAASCLQRNKRTPFMVTANIYYQKEYMFWEEDIIFHPDCNTDNRTDLALLIIKKSKHPIKEIPSNEYVSLVAPDSLIEVDDVGATIYGYGRTSKNSQMSTNLYSDSINTVTVEKCLKTIKIWQFDFTMTDRHICSINEKRGTCWGDEGGALVVEERGTKYLAGVISEHLGECGDFGPTIYTRISSYYSWINGNIP